jgi:hypothetical protein
LSWSSWPTDTRRRCVAANVRGVSLLLLDLSGRRELTRAVAHVAGAGAASEKVVQHPVANPQDHEQPDDSDHLLPA